MKGRLCPLGQAVPPHERWWALAEVDRVWGAQPSVTFTRACREAAASLPYDERSLPSSSASALPHLLCPDVARSVVEVPPELGEVGGAVGARSTRPRAVAPECERLTGRPGGRQGAALGRRPRVHCRASLPDRRGGAPPSRHRITLLASARLSTGGPVGPIHLSARAGARRSVASRRRLMSRLVCAALQLVDRCLIVLQRVSHPQAGRVPLEGERRPLSLLRSCALSLFFRALSKEPGKPICRG